MNKKIRYKATIANRIEVPDYISSGKTINVLTGFDINTKNNEGYIIKQCSSADKSALIRIKNINSPTASIRGCKILNYQTFGMTFYNNYLYIVSKDSTVVKTSGISSKDTPIVYQLKDKNGKETDCHGITYYKDGKFIIMDNAENTKTKMCFLIGTFNEATHKFIETERFYVMNSTGYLYYRDIYYHPIYGLFITVNKRQGTVSNTIMRVDISQKTNIYYPQSEYAFEGITAKYPEFNVMGISIGGDGKLYTAIKLKKGNGWYKNCGIFYASNIVFPTTANTIEVTFDCNKGVVIDTPTFVGADKKTYGYVNPGGFALDGMKGYCLKTYTGKSLPEKTNKASVLMSSSNVSNTKLSRVGNNELTTMGHGNGMTYYNGALYVAAYNRDVKPIQKQIAKVGVDGYLKSIYECDDIIGSISYYGNGKFIVGDYESKETRYSYQPIFYIGSLDENKKRFIKESQFCVKNPIYDSSNPSSSVLQDICYSSKYGLFYCTKTGKTQRVYRVTPEQISKALPNVALVPVEVYIPKSIGEIESFAIGSDGRLYFSENRNDTLTNSEHDYVKQITTFIFY